MKRLKRFFGSVPFLVFVFLVFLGVYLYPYIADRWNAYRASKLIDEYRAQMSVPEAVDKYADEYAKAVAYNEALAARGGAVVAKQGASDKEYESILDVNGEGMMGYIEIPRLQVEIPIYHYSTEDILSEGVGHVYGSSFPVGGENTRCLLTGHRGLPESKLFTDLDKVETGDKFYIHVLGHDLAYEVYDISTVLPREVDMLVVEKGEDLVTLVTCTPYGTNTHRLLVTGKRCAYDVAQKEEEYAAGRVEQTQEKFNPRNAMVAGLIVFVVILCVSAVMDKRKGKKKRHE